MELRQAPLFRTRMTTCCRPLSQVLNRLTYASMLSHLRRVVNPTGRDGKMAKMRQLHNTHWGMVCPAEPPEGQAGGLVKNLSLMSQITAPDPDVQVIAVGCRTRIVTCVHMLSCVPKTRALQTRTRIHTYLTSLFRR